MTAWVLGLAMASAGQSAPGIDDQKVAAAVERGLAWLRTARSAGVDFTKKKLTPIRNSDDLLLLTFLHAGVPADDAKIQALLKSVLEAPYDKTYTVGVRAMALEEYDRVRFQPHLARCAQFLVDNQLTSGQWGYGEPSPALDALPPLPAVAPGPRRDKSKAVPGRKLLVRPTRTLSGYGDFSNSQYAALGLRACHDGGVTVPKEILGRAAQAWVVAQASGPAPAGGTRTLSSGRKPRGWCYDHPCACPLHRLYGSMTAGGVGSLAIYDHLLGRDSRRKGAMLDGLAWLEVHYAMDTVPGPIEWDYITKTTYLPYYLYAVERAGMLTGNEKIGPHFWYSDGAKVLLEAQKPDGSWELDDWGNATWDTCFAILFLKRATRPLVASVDRFKED